MANTVDIQTINDGERNVVIKVFLASDGAAGELTTQVIVDASALVPVPDTLKVIKVQAQLTGFTANLYWDATTDDELLHLSAGQNEYCFKHFGGIPNPKSTGSTGDIIIATTGFTAIGDDATIVLHCQK